MRKQLAEYRAEMKRRHGPEVKVRVTADRGWTRGTRWVGIELTAPGFRTLRANMAIELDGTFSVR